MNKRHLDNQISGINVWLRQRKFRVKQSLGVSERQVDLTKRVMKVREKIKEIPDDKKILVFTDKVHAYHMLKYADLGSKNIKGFLDNNNNDYIFDASSDEMKQYDVLYMSEETFKDVDIILGSYMKGKPVLEDEIRELGFKGEFKSIYDENDSIAMFCVPGTADDSENVSDVAKQIASMINPLAPKFCFEMVERINAVNEKLKQCDEGTTLVYCVGGHTNMLFDMTDMKYKNVVGFVDKNARVYAGFEVKAPAKEVFEAVDHIVISSFYFQEEVAAYLKDLGFEEKIVCLYDNTDMVPFYELPNVYAPDLNIKESKKSELLKFGQSKYGINFADVSQELEEKCGDLTKTSNYFVTYNLLDDSSIDDVMLRKKSESAIIREKNYNEANKITAIIVQGPIIYKGDFTYITLKMYKLIFPDATIILSTWKSEEQNEGFERFKKLGIDIVLSDTPEMKGVLNLNFQLISTNAGLKRAKELGLEYALKTRTDFRIYAEDAISYVNNLTRRFPSKTPAKARITVLPPIADVPYYIPDFIFYGTVDDLLEMWTDETLFPNESINENPEMKLISRYLKKIGCYIESPMEDISKYMDLISKVFIVVDESAYKYVWDKYTYEGSVKYAERENRFNATDWFNRQEF
ncbi:MAG: WavE lipopolysaccharide synthesis family protein [Parasporobacterium sp.]|nr:WavE lipopolysaccharide synthesis family protein [Parasporobacterium sp.]